MVIAEKDRSASRCEEFTRKLESKEVMGGPGRAYGNRRAKIAELRSVEGTLRLRENVIRSQPVPRIEGLIVEGGPVASSGCGSSAVAAIQYTRRRGDRRAKIKSQREKGR